MKIISLNIRAGRMFENLIDFVVSHAKDTDIFCFQEVMSTTTDVKIVDEYYRANIFQELEQVLPGFKAILLPIQERNAFNGPVDFDLTWAQAFFIRKGVEISEVGNKFIFGDYNTKEDTNQTMPRALQYARVEDGGESFIIVHFHGLWTGGGKDDTPERREQSNIINAFLRGRSEKIVLLGDYNLNPDTISLELLVEGRRNLISEFNIKTTRSKLYGKPLQFADYAIVSNDVEVLSFDVPYTEASDHLPLVLEIK